MKPSEISEENMMGALADMWRYQLKLLTEGRLDDLRLELEAGIAEASRKVP